MIVLNAMLQLEELLVIIGRLGYQLLLMNCSILELVHQLIVMTNSVITFDLSERDTLCINHHSGRVCGGLVDVKMVLVEYLILIHARNVIMLG